MHDADSLFWLLVRSWNNRMRNNFNFNKILLEQKMLGFSGENLLHNKPRKTVSRDIAPPSDMLKTATELGNTRKLATSTQRMWTGRSLKSVNKRQVIDNNSKSFVQKQALEVFNNSNHNQKLPVANGITILGQI